MTVPVAETMSIILADYKENYSKVRKLLDEDSKNDPESERHTKYKAKKILCFMNETLRKHTDSEFFFEGNWLKAMLGTVLLNIGIIDMETGMLTSSADILSEATTILAAYSSKPEIVITIINVYNNLGIVWSKREEPEKAKMYLLQAKEVYETFKCTLLMPLPLEHILNSGETNPADFMLLEKAHTLSLFYLAQLYDSLKQMLKSAIYCHVSLRRQLQYQDFEPVTWALNCATLSLVFAEQNGFFQSRHHLAAATTILKQYGDTLEVADAKDDVQLFKLKRYKHNTAELARCWVRYCILIMTASKNRLMNDVDGSTEAITDMSNLSLEDEGNICGGDLKSLVFPDLYVSAYESTVTDKFLLTYQDAREVFLCCRTWLDKAKEFYKIGDFVSDNIELIQACSQSYYNLAFFEEDNGRKAIMHKRRINMLEELINDINFIAQIDPPINLKLYCRTLWFELGEAYTDILDIKLENINKTNEKPTPHSLNKINMLADKSIEKFERFLNSDKAKNGKMPVKLEHDTIKPVACAHVLIAKNSMKRTGFNKALQLRYVTKSYESYKAVVDICKNYEDAAAMMKEELSHYQKMVNVLPLKIKKLQAELDEENAMEYI